MGLRIGIVGCGVVGKNLKKMLTIDGITLSVYDKHTPDNSDPISAEVINECDMVFVAVPTPAQEESGACDLSAVEEVVSWVKPPICIKSTVTPGTTDRLIRITGKRIVFSPEYMGETPYHLYGAQDCSRLPDLVVVGGDRATRELFLDAYRLALGPTPRYFGTESVTAELSKYMENCFFATKVSFVAQFHELASVFGIEFTELREIWLADSRIGRSHSAVIGSPGFAGKCLPKDLSAIISCSTNMGYVPPLLVAVQDFNTMIRESSNVSRTTIRDLSELPKIAAIPSPGVSRVCQDTTQSSRKVSTT